MTAQLSLDFTSQFDAYHRENPQIYEAFKECALRAIHRGYDHWSANGIFEILRWETPISGNDDYKVNNNYRALYARMFARDFREHKDFFRTRTSKFDEELSNVLR